MKWLQRLNTVFYRLIISYTVLIMIIIGTIGTGSYLYFSSSLNEQIEKMNQSSLHQMGESIMQHVVEQSEETYIRLVMQVKETNDFLLLFDSNYESGFMKIVNAHQILLGELQNPLSVIDTIDVYYKENQLGISSKTGVTYYREPRSSKPEWLLQMEEADERTAWLPIKDERGANTISFVKAYPYAQPKERVKGYIAITVKSDAIGNIIQSSALSKTSSLLLLDRDMQQIASGGTPTSEGRLSKLSSYFANAADEGNESIDFDAGPAIVSFTTLPITGWKILSMTPVDEFYQKSIALRNTLILFCIVVILIGVIISQIFTWNLYNPIKRLFHAAAVLLGPSTAIHQKPVNEISYINYVINNLSVKVHKLESTLQHNLPLIKHHIVHSILHESYPGGKELMERMGLLHLKWSYSRYCCVRLRLDPAAFMTVDVQNKHFIKYNLLEELESFQTDKRLVLAIEISETDICCIFGHDSESLASIHSVMESIIGYCRSNYMLSCSVAAGCWVDELTKLGDSFRETETILKYAYFRQEAVLSGEWYLAREANPEPLPADIVTSFDLGLHRARISEIQEALERARILCEEGPYSADQCHEGWRQLVVCLRRNIRENGLSSEEVIDASMQEKLRGVQNIIQFEEWLLTASGCLFQLLEKKLVSRKYEMVEKACRYIEEHLQEPISLELVAEHVYLTPRYLSKLFKEEKGCTFTEFVTSLRLYKAKELIETTSHTVEQISILVGFSSSAYFIRKFKEAFGSTPKLYKSRIR